jgi:hypothetical protein
VGDEHTLDQYLALVDKYTLASPQLGAFLLSQVTEEINDEEATVVRHMPSGETLTLGSLTQQSTRSAFVLPLLAASAACGLSQAPLTSVELTQAVMIMFVGA